MPGSKKWMPGMEKIIKNTFSDIAACGREEVVLS